MKILGMIIILGIGVLYFIFTFLKTIFMDLYIRIFVPQNLVSEYEASNVVKKSVIISTICCQLDIKTKIPKYDNCDDFYDAIINGKFKIARKIISNGYNINKGDKNRATILMHLATMNDAKEKIKFLLKNGIDINATDKYGRSALHYALLSFKAENMDYLLNNGADINVVDNNKVNLLLYALYSLYSKSQSFSPIIIDMLIAHRIQLSSSDMIGVSEVDFMLRLLTEPYTVINLYQYAYGDSVSLKRIYNNLFVYIKGIKALRIKFWDTLTNKPTIQGFAEFNIHGCRQVTTLHSIKCSEIAFTATGIYNCHDKVFKVFAFNRKERTVSIIEDVDDKASELFNLE